MEKVQPERGNRVAQGEDRRRSRRVLLRIPVIVAVSMDEGEHANTVAVNVHGAMLVCPHPFEAGAILQIQNTMTRERIAGRVTRTPRESLEGYLVPIEFEKPAPSFWQIAFPPTDE
jgi:hypothetical protein